MNKEWHKKRQRRAYAFVAEAKKSGLLKQQPCAICGDLKAVAHHETYNKPLTVEWLCLRHHTLRHREIGWTPAIRLARRQARARERYLQNKDYYKKRAKTAKLAARMVEAAMLKENGKAYITRASLAERHNITIDEIKCREAEGIYRPSKIGARTFLYKVRHLVELEVAWQIEAADKSANFAS